MKHKTLLEQAQENPKSTGELQKELKIFEDLLEEQQKSGVHKGIIEVTKAQIIRTKNKLGL